MMLVQDIFKGRMIAKVNQRKNNETRDDKQQHVSVIELVTKWCQNK